MLILKFNPVLNRSEIVSDMKKASGLDSWKYSEREFLHFVQIKKILAFLVFILFWNLAFRFYIKFWKTLFINSNINTKLIWSEQIEKSDELLL